MKNLRRYLLLIALIPLLVGCTSLLTLPDNAIITPDTENNWEIKQYVNSYGEKTDKAYIQTKIHNGIFSNMATNGSECSGEFLVNDNGGVEIFIYQYNKFKVGILEGSEEYYLTIWEGDTVLYKGTAFLSGDRFLAIHDREIINAIATTTQEKLRIRLSGGKYDTTTYHFEIFTKGFASKCLMIMKEK